MSLIWRPDVSVRTSTSSRVFNIVQITDATKLEFTPGLGSSGRPGFPSEVEISLDVRL